jgi:hypothetical protein
MKSKEIRCVSVLLISCFFLLLPGVLTADDIIAYIGEVGGEVSIVRASEDETITAELGMLLAPGDVVKTGEESYASIVFQDDGSRVKLDEGSQLTLNATRQQKKLSKRLFLETGKIWARIAKRRGTDVEVKTPTSVASVKGTKFALEEKEWGETNLWVFEDFVLLSVDGAEAVINEGQKGRATKGKIDVEDIVKEDLPVEPGKHELIFYLRREDDSSMLKELHIEYEKK